MTMPALEMTPIRARVPLLALVGALLLMLGSCANIGRGDDGLFTLTVTQAELQRDLETGFPVRKCAMKIACAKFSEPQLAMHEGADRLSFDSVLQVDLLTLRFPGHITLSALPRYDAAKAAFYLEGVHVEQLSVDGVPPEIAQMLREESGRLLQPMFDEHPIHRINTNSLRGYLLRRTLRSVQVVNGQLRASFALIAAPVST